MNCVESDILVAESLEFAAQRYCGRMRTAYLAAAGFLRSRAASGMEARSGETGTGSTEGASPTAAPSGGDAPTPGERGSGD
jgi:hypothetical protein